jgi:hypothetical protein
MRMTLRQQAEPGCRFADGALAALVGGDVPVNLGSCRKRGIVIEARAVEDGAAMELTVEVPEDDGVGAFERAFSPRLNRFSIGERR